MAELTPEQARIAEERTLELLNSIPVARDNPFASYLNVSNEISTLEKTIKLLKAFVRFLSALNPKQYFEWMSKAFAGFRKDDLVAQPVEEVAPVATLEAPTPEQAPAVLPPPVSAPAP